jgi:hypothetical protein
MTRIVRLAVVTVALAIIVAAGAMVVALNPSRLGGGALGWRLAAGEDRLALAALEKKDFTTAERASRSALDLAPYDTGALTRLVYIDRVRAGVLGQPGLEALALSYKRVPYDRAVGLWRINLGLENWERLTPPLRQSVRAEVIALAAEPGHRWPLRILMERIANPRGRMVGAIWAAQIAQMQAP